MNDYDIVVSVLMLSYNHEDTIARAIDGIICQQTKYKLELIIGDDASTDKSQKIIREYASRYNDIIVPVCREENLGINKNLRDIIMRAKGRYIAFCEGDDYWIDENKLDKQITFLEEHSAYSSCYTRCCMLVNGIEVEYPFATSETASLVDMLNGGNVKRYATCTFACRNLYRDYPQLLNAFERGSVGDIIMQTIAAKYGKIYYIDTNTAVYDKTTTGESFSSGSIERQIIYIREAIETCKTLSGNENSYLWDMYMANYDASCFWAIKEKDSIRSIKWLMGLKRNERKAVIKRIIKDYKDTKKCII